MGTVMYVRNPQGPQRHACGTGARGRIIFEQPIEGMLKIISPEETMATLQAVEQKQLIHYGVEGGVAIIEMDDPPANTYTYEMMQQIDSAILQARMDENAHVIVLRGKGEKFFSAGGGIPLGGEGGARIQYYFCL